MNWLDIHCEHCGQLLSVEQPETGTHWPTPEELFAAGAVPVPHFGWFCGQQCATRWEERGKAFFQRDEDGDARYYPRPS